MKTIGYYDHLVFHNLGQTPHNSGDEDWSDLSSLPLQDVESMVFVVILLLSLKIYGSCYISGA